MIAGERRLRACRLLNWTRIPAHVVDLAEIVRGELAENIERQNFLPSEIDAIRRALEPIEKAAAKTRMSEGGKVGKLSTPSLAGKTRDKIGAFAGVSGRSVEHIREIVEAAERDPRRFGPLVEEMDRVRHVAGPYRKLRRALDEDRVASLVVKPGRYRTLVINSPWPWDMSGRAGLDYASMPLDQIAALPVGSWAEDDAHLYVWTTNAHLAFACAFMAGWGFTQKGVLTWVKPSFGIGSYFRNSTEHVLFGVRGHLPTKPAAASIRTHFEAPPSAHSEKPEAFYDIVRAASHAPYGEAFQRKVRPDFANVYAATAEAAE